MTHTHDIVAKLWNLCHILRDDGVTYHQYVTELTYLLFLKMAQETETEGQLPEGYRWQDLLGHSDNQARFDFYRKLLIDLEHDILSGCVITHGGEVVNETIKNLLAGGE